MKKVLSLILALAMVFTMMPLAFAGDEDVQTVYDIGEAFAVSETFTGNMAVDYPNKSFTPAYKGSEWQIGYYALAKGDDHAIVNGIETFVPFTTLHRAQGSWARMKEDTVNGYTFAESSASHDIIYAPAFYENFWGSGTLGEVTSDFAWANVGTLKVTGTATVTDAEGNTTTHASDGYKQNNNNGHIGNFGYTYGSKFDINVRASSTGYFSNSGAAMKAAIFTAPRSGLINVTLAHYAQNADRVIYQLYKLDANGNKTVVYPTADEKTATFSNTFGSETREWTVPEKWKEGWGILSNTSDDERDDGNVWVNKDDQLIIRYAAINAGMQDFNLSKLIYTYKDNITTTYTGEYKADRKIDLTKAFTLPLSGGTIAVDTAVLTATETAGVYTLADSYVDGTATTITLTNNGVTETMTATFASLPLEYDAAEAFYTKDTYGTGYKYTTAGQTPKNANNGTGTWSIGYYQMNGTGNLGNFTNFAKLFRSNNTARAYEDTARASTHTTHMTWALANADTNEDATVGTYMPWRNGNVGSAGYGFGSDTVANNTSTGYANENVITYIFNVPRSGVVNPQLVASGGGDSVIYRIDKVAKDGTRTTIYPAKGDADACTWVPNKGSAVPAGFETWGKVKNAGIKKDDQYVRVNVGDQIVTYFAADAGHKEFCVTSLKMVYYEGKESDLYPTFDGGYGKFKTSDCGYDYDSYILPYYADASERNLYGTIDLGLSDAWANATVSFDKAGKFEYLGNGRIRAISSYTFTEAGGAYHAPTDTSVKSYAGNQNLKSARDRDSMGTPVVMTVTAADGGTAKFGLWAFPAAVGATANDDGDVTYALNISGTNQISNGVVSVEGYNSVTGTFNAAYYDAANENTALSPLADERYTTNYQYSGPSITAANIYFPAANTYYQSYVSNNEWHNITGISRTFTAPRDGEVTVSNDYIPSNYAVNGGCWFISSYFEQQGEISFDVNLYNADDTKVATLYHANYVKNEEDVSGSAYGLKVANEYFYGDSNTTFSTVSGLTVDFDTDKNMTLSLDKGQKIRVILNVKAVPTSGAYFTFGQANAAKTPTFTYKGTANTNTFEVNDNAVMATVYVDDASVMNANGTFAVFYDANGNMTKVAPIDGDDNVIDTDEKSVNFYYELDENDVEPAYVKVFFWKDMNNIQPLAGEVTVVK